MGFETVMFALYLSLYCAESVWICGEYLVICVLITGLSSPKEADYSRIKAGLDSVLVPFPISEVVFHQTHFSDTFFNKMSHYSHPCCKFSVRIKCHISFKTQQLSHYIVYANRNCVMVLFNGGNSSKPLVC